MALRRLVIITSVGAGVILGAIAIIGSIEANRLTSGDEFCIRMLMYAEWQL
jgi:hypothetical protein